MVPTVLRLESRNSSPRADRFQVGVVISATWLLWGVCRVEFEGMRMGLLAIGTRGFAITVNPFEVSLAHILSHFLPAISVQVWSSA